MSIKEINKKIKKIPPHLLPEINDYIDFLIEKHSKTKEKKKSFTFNWQGGLSDISKQYTSVDLQHKSNNWR